MSPRPYQLGQRQTGIEQARRHVLDAARALLAESERYTGFTIGKVAQRADVARATVYYQFGSKTGLLEALCDDLAQAGRMDQLAAAFATADPDQALRDLIGAFARFWSVDRTVMRRLRSLAALDPDVAAVITARDQRRQEALRAMLGRRRDITDLDAAVRVVHTLTSFETLDNLLTQGCPQSQAVELLIELAGHAIAERSGVSGPAGIRQA